MIKVVKKSPWRPWRLGGSKACLGGSVVENISAPPRLRVSSPYTRGTGPAANRGFVSSCLRGKSAPGFTLMEMLVVLAIMVIMMAAVGEIFSLAGHSVRLGQATLKVMANVRAVQAQLAKDVSHIDTNGYLIIRQSNYAPLWLASVQYEPGDEVNYGGFYYRCSKQNTANTSNAPPNGSYWQGPLPLTISTPYGPDIIYPWRDDQITFIAHGSFQSRTGNNGTSSASPLVDCVTSNSAAVWYGQLTASYGSSATTGSLTPGLAEERPYWSQSTSIPQGQPPSGETAGDFYLGRHVLLLAPSTNANTVTVTINGSNYTDAAYSNIFYNGNGNSNMPQTAVAGERPADITSSRLDLATITPAAIEAAIVTMAPPLSATIPDDYCYRFASLVTPAASNQMTDQLINGYFRMTPILLPGVPSFSVDVGYVNTLGVLQWYGPDYPSNNLATNPNPTLYPSWDPTLFSISADQGDIQSLVFDAANRPYWPTALRITYTVTDPHNRMEGGQTITQIIQLPQ